MEKYSNKIAWAHWSGVKVTATFEAWKCLNMDEILYTVVHRTNQCTLIIQPNFNRETDAILTDKISMKDLIGLRR